MSQPAYEMLNGILDIWKITIQAAMFLVLWAAAFREKKGKRDSIAAVVIYPCQYRDWLPSVCRMGAVWRFCFRNNGVCRDML